MTRYNQGLFAEAHASVDRIHVTGGVAYDHNDSFDSAFSPRVSVAAYLRTPSARARFGDTKLVFNAGQGIKAPSIFQEVGSLFALLTPEQAAALNVGPIDPDGRARSTPASSRHSGGTSSASGRSTSTTTSPT